MTFIPFHSSVRPQLNFNYLYFKMLLKDNIVRLYLKGTNVMFVLHLRHICLYLSPEQMHHYPIYLENKYHICLSTKCGQI